MTTVKKNLIQAAANINLAELEEKFFVTPSAANAAKLLRKTLDYWSDGSINDDGLFYTLRFISHRMEEEERIQANLRMVLDT